jgi:hypothetical protein
MGPRAGDYLAGHQAAAAYEGRKRTFDELNDFFGAAKRRQVDPTNYSQVGRSLMPLQGLSAAGGGLAAEYMTAPPVAVPVSGPASHGPGPLAQHYYLPPMPSLRTKDDLQHIDSLLEQMQSTIYENSGQSPNSQYTPALDMRHHSPAARPAFSSDHYAVSAAHVASPLTAVSSSHGGSPAVTPPSSNLSYTSGHSPTASTSALSPTSRQGSTASVSYPQLPAVSGGYNPGSTTTSTLASNFNPVERRLSGGMLQAGARRAADTETSSGASTPRAEAAVSSPSDESDSSEPEPYESWLQNIRTIEFLREYVQERIRRRDYVDDDEGSRIDPMVLDDAKSVEKPLYPDLKMTDN